MADVKNDDWFGALVTDLPPIPSTLGFGADVSIELGTGLLSEQIGHMGRARLSGDAALELMVSRYNEDINFVSAEFKDQWLGQTVCIVGSGPSINDTFDELLELVAAGAKVCAVNAAHDWLISKGIIPTFAVMADPKPWCAEYQMPHREPFYLLATQCHNDVFARFRGHPKMFAWHALGDEQEFRIFTQVEAIRKAAERTGKGAYMVTGGSTTTMRSMDIMTFLGFRRHHFFGVDSSGRRDGTETVMHGHAKPHVVAPEVRPVFVCDPTNKRDLAREFWSNGPMEHQALHWETVLRQRFDQMRRDAYPIIQIVVHGEGLWPALAAMYGLHHDPGYADRLRAEGYLDDKPKETML